MKKLILIAVLLIIAISLFFTKTGLTLTLVVFGAELMLITAIITLTILTLIEYFNKKKKLKL